MLRTPVGLALGAVVVLGVGAMLVVGVHAIRLGVRARRVVGRAISG